jgi:hypothetical protein
MAAGTGWARVEQGASAAAAQNASAAPIFRLGFIDTFELRQPYVTGHIIPFLHSHAQQRDGFSPLDMEQACV